MNTCERLLFPQYSAVDRRPEGSDFCGIHVPSPKDRDEKSREQLYQEVLSTYNALDPELRKNVDLVFKVNFGVASAKYAFALLDSWGLYTVLRSMLDASSSIVNDTCTDYENTDIVPDDTPEDICESLLFEKIGRPHRNTRRHMRFALSKRDIDRMYKIIKNSPENIRKRHERKLYKIKNRNALKRYDKMYNTMVKKGLTHQTHHRGVEIK